MEENKTLKKEVDKLKPLVDKFTCSSDKLQMILNNQRRVYDRAGLRYKPSNK